MNHMMDADKNQFVPVPENHVPLVTREMEQGKPASPVVRGRSMKADVFYIGEKVTIKSYVYQVELIGADGILFKPVGPIVRKVKK